MNKKNYWFIVAILILAAIILLVLVDIYFKPVIFLESEYPALYTQTPTITPTSGWWVTVTPIP